MAIILLAWSWEKQCFYHWCEFSSDALPYVCGTRPHRLRAPIRWASAAQHRLFSAASGDLYTIVVPSMGDRYSALKILSRLKVALPAVSLILTRWIFCSHMFTLQHYRGHGRKLVQAYVSWTRIYHMHMRASSAQKFV